MSPVAHSAIGLLGWQSFSEKRKLHPFILFILIANLPDFDFPLYLLLGEKRVGLHQFYTHNMFFVLLTALVSWFFLKSHKARLGILLVSLSHLFLDYFTIDAVEPIGFRLFYPFSHRLFNFGIFPNLLKANWAEVFSLHNFLSIGFETLVFGGLIFLYYSAARTNNPFRLFVE